MRLSKRGSGLAFRIPAEVVRAVGLQAGDPLKYRVIGGRRIEFTVDEGRRQQMKRKPAGATSRPTLRTRKTRS